MTQKTPDPLNPGLRCGEGVGTKTSAGSALTEEKLRKQPPFVKAPQPGPTDRPNRGTCAAGEESKGSPAAEHPQGVAAEDADPLHRWRKALRQRRTRAGSTRSPDGSGEQQPTPGRPTWGWV